MLRRLPNKNQEGEWDLIPKTLKSGNPQDIVGLLKQKERDIVQFKFHVNTKDKAAGIGTVVI